MVFLEGEIEEARIYLPPMAALQFKGPTVVSVYYQYVSAYKYDYYYDQLKLQRNL